MGGSSSSLPKLQIEWRRQRSLGLVMCTQSEGAVFPRCYRLCSCLPSTGKCRSSDPIVNSYSHRLLGLGLSLRSNRSGDRGFCHPHLRRGLLSILHQKKTCTVDGPPRQSQIRFIPCSIASPICSQHARIPSHSETYLWAYFTTAARYLFGRREW